MLNISREIYRYICYIGRNISGKAAHVIWCRIELIFSICWMVCQNWHESLPIFKHDGTKIKTTGNLPRTTMKSQPSCTQKSGKL